MSADTDPGKDGKIHTTTAADAAADAEELEKDPAFLLTPEQAEIAEVISPGVGAVAKAIMQSVGKDGCSYFSGQVDEAGNVVIDLPQG